MAELSACCCFSSSSEDLWKGEPNLAQFTFVRETLCYLRWEAVIFREPKMNKKAVTGSNHAHLEQVYFLLKGSARACKTCRASPDRETMNASSASALTAGLL